MHYLIRSPFADAETKVQGGVTPAKVTELVALGCWFQPPHLYLMLYSLPQIPCDAITCNMVTEKHRIKKDVFTQRRALGP